MCKDTNMPSVTHPGVRGVRLPLVALSGLMVAIAALIRLHVHLNPPAEVRFYREALRRSVVETISSTLEVLSG